MQQLPLRKSPGRRAANVPREERSRGFGQRRYGQPPVEGCDNSRWIGLCQEALRETQARHIVWQQQHRDNDEKELRPHQQRKDRDCVNGISAIVAQRSSCQSYARNGAHDDRGKTDEMPPTIQAGAGRACRCHSVPPRPHPIQLRRAGTTSYGLAVAASALCVRRRAIGF